MGKQKQKITMNKAVRGSYLKKGVLTNQKKVKTRYGVFFLVFLTGVATSIIWMANFDAGVPIQASNDTSELVNIESAIKEKKAKWTAGETSVSKLSPEERKKRLGLKKEDTGSYLPSDQGSIMSSVAVLPPTFDWRNNNGNFVTPIKNQGSCGSCWAFATTAVAESDTLIASHTPYEQNPIDLSEQVMVSCSGAGSCSGGYFSSASSFLKSTGLPAESCYPYTATNGACSSACANWQSSTTKISDYTSWSSPDFATIKNALIAYGPLVAEMSVYSDFYYYANGVYSYASGSYQGEHAVTIIGYDDANQYFIVKNSWGVNWGEAGYFNIAYSQLAGSVRFGSWVYAYAVSDTSPGGDVIAPQVTIGSPSAGATVFGIITVSASALDNVGVVKAELYINDIFQGSDTSSPYSFIWNTAPMSNGSYALMVKAYDAAGNIGASSVVTVTVFNAAPIPDATSPIVSITSPTNGGSYTKNMKVNAIGTDNVGVVSMQAYIDTALVCSSVTGTLRCSVNISRKISQGSHTVTVKAVDAAGNTGTVTANVTFK